MSFVLYIKVVLKLWWSRVPVTVYLCCCCRLCQSRCPAGCDNARAGSLGADSWHVDGEGNGRCGDVSGQRLRRDNKRQGRTVSGFGANLLLACKLPISSIPEMRAQVPLLNRTSCPYKKQSLPQVFSLSIWVTGRNNRKEKVVFGSILDWDRMAGENVAGRWEGAES